MLLPVSFSEISSIPASAFNEDGLAVVMLNGQRAGGDWTVVAYDPPGDNKYGELQTQVTAGKSALMRAPSYPDYALETAFAWLMNELAAHGMRVVAFDSFNGQYPPDQAPFFCSARVLIASRDFTPVPGLYADELPWAAVLAGAASAEASKNE